MPTRDQFSDSFPSLADRAGLPPSDPLREMLLHTLEAFNATTADIDDELDFVADRVGWLSTANWVNHRPYPECVAFIESRLSQCERDLAKIRARWEGAKRQARSEA